jgi:hypothetical protein
VEDRGPIHADVIVITEMQEFFFGELSAVVGNDTIRDPETKNDVLDEIHDLLGADFSQGFRFDPLSKLIDRDEQVGKAPGAFLKGPRRSRPPHDEGPDNGDRLELLGWDVNLSSKILASPT